MTSRRLFRPVIAALILVAGCSSAPQKTPVPECVKDYYSRIRNELEPILSKKTKEEIKKILASGLTVRQLKTPENTVTLNFEVDRSGRVENVQTLQKSEYEFFNKVALNTITNAGAIPAPPIECFKEDHSQIRWQFILKTK